MVTHQSGQFMNQNQEILNKYRRIDTTTWLKGGGLQQAVALCQGGYSTDPGGGSGSSTSNRSLGQMTGCRGTRGGKGHRAAGHSATSVLSLPDCSRPN